MANAVGTPVFNDFFYDCAPTGIVPGYTQLINGSNVCVDICASCSDVACYANYVDSYVSPLGVWNGGTKVLLDPVSNLQVNVLSGNGTTLMGGSDGEITFSITDTTYVGMTWNIYIDSIIPSTSGLTYDSNLQSGTYGSVNCSTQVCCPMGVLSQVNTNTCPGNSTGWAFELSESGVEICPTLDGNSDSTGQYAYQPAFTGGSVTKTFTLTNLSVVNSPATTGSDNEVMYIIRLVTDLGCVDCDAHVIDNGLRNLFDIYLAEDCECHCEPGFTLQTDGTCDGEYISAAETNCKCFESDGTVSSFTNQTDCQTAGLFWNCEWTATTIQQNAPSVWNTLTWGAVGAQLFGQFTDLVTANFGTVDISSASLPLSRIENAGAFNTIPATAAVLVDNNSTLYSFADSMAFSNTNSLFTSRLLTIGIWPAAINLYTSVSDPFVPSNEWVGITTCITLNQTTDFILGCAAKDKFRLTINGELIIDFGFFGWTNTGPLQTMNSSTWNLIPIGLPSGDYTLTFEGSNDGTMGGAAFAFELYPVDLGSTPTQNLLADAGLTDSTNTIGYAGGSVGLADIVVLDNNNNPISSAHYINSPIHTGSMVGYHCNPSTEYFSNCGGSNVCISALEGEECELPINCPEYLDDIVGCIGDLGDVVYNRLLGGLMKGGEGYREDLANIWRVILIKFLFRHSYSCLSQENLLSFAKFLNKLCPDCESKIKTYQDVNYLEDPNSSNTGIAGLNQTPDINTFDF